MPLDPWEVLGVRRDASLAEVKAAYRRLAALFHPDHLHGMSETVRVEGERRLLEAKAAFEALQARLRPEAGEGPEAGDDGGPGISGGAGGTVGDEVAPAFIAAADGQAQPSSRVYNAQVRSLEGDGLHATWPGRHAAAVWAVLRRAHTVDGPVQQVEWGAYECTLPGVRLRGLLGGAMAAGEADWRRVPLETLHVGAPGRRRSYHGGSGQDPPGVMDLEMLAELVDDGCRYLVTAEIFSGFD